MRNRVSVPVLAGLLAIGAGILFRAEAAGQLVRLDPHRTSAGFNVDASTRGNDPGSSTGSTALTEWFIVPLSGSFLDPRILGYSFELRPRFTQHYATDLPASLNTRDVGVAARASLFSTLPVSLDATYNRSSGTLSGGFGAKGEFGNTAVFSVLSFDNVYLPMNVSYTGRSRRNMTEVGANLTPVETSDALRSVRFSARNSKLNANFVWTTQDDRLADDDFSLRDFDIGHRLRWGKGSTLLSRAEWSRRTGAAPYDRHSWEERLRIRHTLTTSTTWSYARYRSDGLDGRIGGSGLSWQIDSRALSWLSLGASASRRSSETESGAQTFSALGPRLALRIRLPFEARFTGDASGAFIRRSIDGSLNGLLQVVNEEHLIDETFFLVLAQPQVEELTVVVRSEDQTIVYQEGIDYVLTTVGESAEIRILPGSRIEEDDRILISYFYQPQVVLEERGLRTAIGAGLSRGGWSLRHSRSDRSTDLSGEGTLPISGDFSQRSTMFSYRGGTPLGRLRLSAVRRDRKSATLDYTSDEASISLGVPAGRRLQIFLDGAARRVVDEEDHVRVLSAGASATWSPAALALDVGLRAQDWRQRGGQDEVDLSARVGVRWRVGLTDLHLRSVWDRRSLRVGSTMGLSMRLDLTRRF